MPTIWKASFSLGGDSKLLNSDKPADWSLSMRIQDPDTSIRNRENGNNLISTTIKSKPLKSSFWEYVQTLTESENEPAPVDRIQIKAAQRKKMVQSQQTVSLAIPITGYGLESIRVVLKESDGMCSGSINLPEGISLERLKGLLSFTAHRNEKGAFRILLNKIIQLGPDRKLRIRL
jgi:hypothetical protein